MSLGTIALSAPKMIGALRRFLPTDFRKHKNCQRTAFVVVCSSSSRQDAPSRECSTEFESFKPPPPIPFLTPAELAAEIPFQFWYSFADLPAGTPKRRPKNIRKDVDRPVTWRKAANETRRTLSTNSNGASQTQGFPSADAGNAAAVLNLNRDHSHFRERVTPGTEQMSATNSKQGDESELESSTDSENGDDATDGQFRADPGNSAAEVDKNAPLTNKEKRALVARCLSNNRQINIGWRMWSVNYVLLVHEYWKKNPVCKIKCKGAITLDMDLVCGTLEQNTGGEVIERAGGTIYLFRGCNYDRAQDAPKKRVRSQKHRKIRPLPKRLPIPKNLTKEDIVALRARAREIPALCKPGRHGVYLTLLNDVRKAFETQDLVRINCQGFESRYMKTLGAELKVRVPCELISFEFEHILMWRRKDIEPLSTKMESD